MADARAQRDDAYRAIGRYTVGFSLLVSNMRQILAQQIAGPEGPQRGLLDVAFGSLTAEPIAEAFFGMCRTVVHLDKGEKKSRRASARR
jgi:hypothetical protein